MGRRAGRRSPSPSFSSRSSRSSNLPARPPPSRTQVAPATQASGPGFMSQVASTAAGVAIGHTVGHALTGALSGSGGSDVAPCETNQTQAAAPILQPTEQNGPCSFELSQFLKCAESYDLSLCEGFSDALKQCKRVNLGSIN